MLDNMSAAAVTKASMMRIAEDNIKQIKRDLRRVQKQTFLP